LVFTQAVNIFTGLTTFERFGYQTKLNKTVQSAEERNSQDPNVTQTVSIVGSTLSSDHPKEYEHTKKGCWSSTCDMMYTNGGNPQFNDSHYRAPFTPNMVTGKSRASVGRGREDKPKPKSNSNASNGEYIKMADEGGLGGTNIVSTKCPD